MAKLTLSPIGSFSQSAITTINQNMDDIETALEKTLSRDGTTPNQMTADLDLNSNDILNVDNLDANNIILNGEVLIPGDVSSTSAAGLLTLIETVDGTGSGLDADLLDGQHGTYYLDRANHTGTQVSTTVLNTQTGTSAVSRTVQSKFAEFVSVKDFGAVGDGTTDDSTAFQNAFNASGYVKIPAGEYKLNSTITISNKAIFISGSGVQNTILKFAASTNGFSISQNSGALPVNVRDLTISTLNNPSSQSANAMSITWPTGWADRFSLKSLMQSVEFRGYDLAANGWTNGVSITQGLNVLFEYCSFIGKDSGLPASSTQATTTVSTTAITWIGGWYPTDFRVSHCYFNAWTTGLSVGGAAEGIAVIDSTFVYVFGGVVWHTGNFDAGLGGGSAAGRPLLLVRGSHFNVYSRAVDTDGVVQIQIHDNDIYHSNLATSAANLINLAHGSDALVHHNIFRKYVASATAAANAIVIGDASTGFTNATIENNDIATAAPNAFDTGVWFRSDCSVSFEKFNIFGTAFNVASVFDQGTNNRKGAVTSGAIIGRAYAEYSTNADLTVAIPLDNTIPQNTEGTQILSLTYTPQSALNRIRLTFMGEGCIAAAGAAIAAALFIDSGANAVQAISSQGTAATRVPIMMTYEYLPGNITSHTYNIRVGGNSGTIRMNGSLTTTDFGAGTQKCTLVLEEIQG